MPDYSAFDAALSAANIPLKKEEPMGRHTTFKIGGAADRFVTVHKETDLQLVLEVCKQAAIPFFILGNGSNLLVPDEGLHGAVIALDGAFRSVYREKDGTVCCGAGITLASLCAFARSNALTGLEFAWGIPGSLGGAIYMNAGAYGGEMQQVVTRVYYLDTDGKTGVLSNEELDFSYRHSAFMGTKRVILRAELTLVPGNPTEISAQMDDLMQRRKTKQPVELPSAGSVFKRPEGHFAGTLIENCGLKGYTVGGARVSEKHAGFIVNIGGATCADVENLISYIQKTVQEKTGVQLEPEIRRVTL